MFNIRVKYYLLKPKVVIIQISDSYTSYCVMHDDGCEVQSLTDETSCGHVQGVQSNELLPLNLRPGGGGGGGGVAVVTND